MGYAQLVEPGRKIKLKDYDPDETNGLTREMAESLTAQWIKELIDLQEILSAACKHSVLIVLQGRDTSGKDGTIRHVFGPLNQQGCRVVNFKVPTGPELAHDFLWRVHQHTPAAGDMTIFNRSHYEDVLVARVHKLVPEKVWRARYAHINNFEHLLTDNNTIIFKFYLHIGKDEQLERLQAREQDKTKYWKLSLGDWQERQHWDDYTEAYEQAINNCSNPYAPWYIIPANKKWFRNLAIAEAVVTTLRTYKKSWLKQLDEIGRRELAAITQYRSQHPE